MSYTPNCPVCQTPLSADAPMGMCPKCLLGTPLFPPAKDPKGQGDMGRPCFYGDYELLDEGREGGMGIVYRARQLGLNRIVALKMIRFKRHVRPSDLARFRIEVEATAALSHDHIVRIYETGEHEGQPYFSMQWMDGGDLRGELKRANGDPMDLRRAARLMTAIARAVHHAHQRGVLHRDLNPRNILFDAEGLPHVADFGLAKLVHVDSELTHTGQGMGSPGYTSPEQASGKTDKLTTVSDVFSLGALFYHLMTGRAPFSTRNWTEFLRQVEETEPQKPTAINPRVDCDLETLCLKCLEKEPARRFPSAEALAEELDRWLRGEPIQARPVTSWERGVKWAKRKPVIAGLTAAIALTFIAGFVGVTSQWLRAEHQRVRAEDHLTRLRLQRADDFFTQGESHLALATLARVLRDQPGQRAAAERLVNALRQRAYLVPSTNVSLVFPPRDEISDVNSIAGLRAVVVDEVGFRIVDGASAQPRLSISNAHSQIIRSLRFSRDGRRLVSGSVDGTAKVWDTRTGGIFFALTNSSAIYGTELSADGAVLVIASRDGFSQLWNTTTHQPIGATMRHLGAVNSARFSPDGRFVVTASDDRTVRVWDAVTGLPVSEPARLPRAVDDARFAPDCRHLVALLDHGATPGFKLTSSLSFEAIPPFAREEPTNLLSLKLQLAVKHSGEITFIDRSPDGRWLATASTDKTAQLWRADTLTLLTAPLVHETTVNCIRFSPDGLRVVTSTAQPTKVCVWDARTGLPLSDWIPSPQPVSDVRFSADGSAILANAGWKWRTHISKGAAPSWLPGLAEAVAGVRLTADGLAEELSAAEWFQVKDILARDSVTYLLMHWAKEFVSDEK